MKKGYKKNDQNRRIRYKTSRKHPVTVYLSPEEVKTLKHICRLLKFVTRTGIHKGEGNINQMLLGLIYSDVALMEYDLENETILGGTLEDMEAGRFVSFEVGTGHTLVPDPVTGHLARHPRVKSVKVFEVDDTDLF